MPVTGTSSGDGVRHFVEEHLVDIIVISKPSEVSGNGDPFFVVVASTKPGLCVVKRKTPRLIQVESDEGICPHFHSKKVSHMFRVGGENTS
jgi:hypothetical protein